MATSRRTSRTCRRPGCARSATATLLLSYVEASVHIEALHDEPHPAHWDMCGEHADGLRVPQGWTRADRRTTSAHADDLAGHHTAAAEEVAHAPAATPPVLPPVTTQAGPPRVNRYAALTACLPQIAASLAAALEPERGPLPPDIPGQLRLPVADPPTDGGPGPDGPDAVADARGRARAPASAGHDRRRSSAPDNVVPLVRRGVDVLDPIG